MGPVVLVFSGEYHLSHKHQLRSELDALHDEPELVLDMTGVTYIDSTCIAELMMLQSYRTMANLPKVSIVQNASSVGRLFDILGIRSMFEVVPTLDDALPKDGKPFRMHLAVPGDGGIGSAPLPMPVKPQHRNP
jgi:anti-anti-sigma factor